MKTNYFTDLSNIEDNALQQVKALEQRDNVSQIAVFPDIHFCDEKAVPVGLAFSTQDVIYPLITGKDMGCGVAYMKIPKTYVIKQFDKNQHYNALNREQYKMTDEGLGGGNHFLSLEEDDNNLYIIVHTGTRNRGIYMYQHNTMLLQEFGDKDYFSVEFLEKNHPNWFKEYNDVIEYGKKRRSQFLIKTMEFLIKNKYVKIEWLQQMSDVLTAKKHCNDSVHNHIKKEGDYWIHRKGATELNNDTVVIPLSMTRGSLFVKKTHEVSNLNSSSHGAGRRLSRTDTLKYWHSSLKERQRKEYREKFHEMLDRSGDFSKGYIQEFDFAYKNSTTLLQDQPFLKQVTQTTPIVTVKFTEI